MATFRERKTDNGETRWQAIIRRKGVKQLVATLPTKRAAERWAAIAEGKIAEHRHLPGQEAERHTVNDLLDRFSPELGTDRRKFITGQIKWWREAIGDKPLSEVTPALLRQQLDRLAAEPYSRAVPRKEKPLSGTKRRQTGAPTYRRSPSTVNRYKKLIGRALSVAHRQYQWIDHNPVASIPDLKEPRGRVRILTNDERTKLLDACATESAELHALVLLALCTGARAGELLNLRWPDIDLDHKRAIAHTDGRWLRKKPDGRSILKKGKRDARNGRRTVQTPGDLRATEREYAALRKDDSQLAGERIIVRQCQCSGRRN